MQMRLWIFGPVILALAACAETGSSFLAGRQALLRGEPDNAVAYFDRVAKADPVHVVNLTLPHKSIWTYVGRAHYNAGRYAEARAALDKALSHLKDDHVARLYLGLTMLRFQTAAPLANAFTLQEISYALREGVVPRRVGAIARERGVAFDLNSETESQLKTAGADAILLDELKKFRVERSKFSTTSDPQRAAGAKELAAALTVLNDWLNYTIRYTTQGRYWDPSGEIRAELARGLRAVAASPRNWEAIISSGESVGYRLEDESDRARHDEAADRQRLTR